MMDETPVDEHEPAIPRASGAAPRTVVLGLGNPILSDDAVGLVIAERVSAMLASSPVAGVDVATSTRAGFELIDLLQGYARAVVVDCLTLPDPVPGRVHRLSVHDVAGSSRLIGPHDVSIAHAVELAQRLGTPMPTDITIIAIEAADTCTFAEHLTPAVAAAVEPVASEICELVQPDPP